MMAALITGTKPPVDATPFRFDRFQVAPRARGGTFVSSYLAP
jgi:glycine/D-amino acid oxidase-like deaminating enzyme